MDTRFKKAFKYKVIYVFTIDDPAHHGLIKIGDATLDTDTPIDQLMPNCRELNQAALSRIKTYTTTAGLTPKILHSEIAVRTVIGADGKQELQSFRDHDVHSVLKNSGYTNVKIGESTGREWFELDLETAKKAINAVKLNHSNLSNAAIVKHTPIIFRPEQAECITKVVKHFKSADRFLINAKMRYGKTFVSLEIVKQCKFKKTLILTHRPVVDAGWYEDFGKIFYGNPDYVYGSKNTGYSVEELLAGDKNFIYFASVQDLRGSSAVGGKFTKNDAIFDTVWSCVIVDEAHEGTTTALGEQTVSAIVKEGSGTKFLALSGTPFNILDNYDDDSIYTWDYVMEQECKSEWDKHAFGDHNPYDELPELRIYTYSLGDILRNKNYVAFEDKAFNFTEFFRIFTGDFSVDHTDMPATASEGDFIHEADVWSFLNLMTKADDTSQYPFSTDEYRALFKHTLWMVPGVKEARALKKLMLKHPVFGSGCFDIINVAGNGDEEEKYEEALQKVRDGIKKAGKDGYTITLSCGKLTTGVTVRQWTGVFMLAGSYSTSAANYLQTIFRVQSPCKEDGKIKETAYVFDFAPDRTLKMVSAAVKVSARAGKSQDKTILGKFLNYCPVISISGSEMEEYSATKLLQQLKKAYADRVVRNGFDDTNLYNDELLKLTDVEIKAFDKLKGIIGTSKAAPKANDIVVNDQGLTNEEYEEKERLEKKKKKELTAEEKARLEELKKKKKLRNDAISILRGISIRMPLLIYGADIPYDEDITLDRFVELVDDSSWNEFMPAGVTKREFKKFKKYYDEEVFIAAGRRIRNIAKEADTLDPTERIKKIAGLFSYFKNPDKETVLTPWRVVNMHMSSCIGGWCFYDNSFTEEERLDEPRFVDQGQVTEDVFGNQESRILEINSKTGLYPLYIAYSAYRRKLEDYSNHELTITKKQKIWLQAVKDNVFVICKTPMAKAITKRTLVGYLNETVNSHYFDDLINLMQNKPNQFISKVLKQSYWKKGNAKMQFNAIVGNPPYQILDGGGKGYSAKPVYNFFVSQAKAMAPQYISMITPSRWFSGGKGLDQFRSEMLHDRSMKKIIDYTDNEFLFKNVSIVGGVNFFLWDREYEGDCEITSIRGDKITTMLRPLNEYDIFIRNNESIRLIKEIESSPGIKMDDVVYARNVFGISSDCRGTDMPDKTHSLAMYCSQKSNSMTTTYIDPSMVVKEHSLISKYKVIIGKVVPRGGEVGVDPSIGYRVISTIQILPPESVFTDSYLLLAAFDSRKEAVNFAKYFCLKLPRFLLHETYSSMNISKGNFRFVPFLDYTREWSDEELFEKYHCTTDEIEMITSIIRPMEYVVHEEEK